MSKYIKKRLKSFKHAFNGIGDMIKEEPNARIYIVLGVIALLLGYFLHISPTEWIVVCAVIGFVFAMEAVNTAIENLADYASNKERHPLIRKAKDLGAAAALIASIVALIAGIIIFLPKLLSL